MNDLQRRIAVHFDRVTQQSHLTIGVEQEFFLLGVNGIPVDHPTSQLFFRSIHGFKNQHWDIDPLFGKYLSSISDEHGNVIKYDHHPFLIEIAVSPSKEVGQIESFLNHCFRASDKAAETCQLRICSDPVLPIPTSSPETLSELSFRKSLLAYRRNLFTLRNEPVQEDLVNYAAGILATQVHIGGVHFSRYNDLLPTLYDLENEMLNWAAPFIKSHLTPEEVLKHRHHVYASTFAPSPLVGKPAFNWTVDSWLNALLDTPLFGTEDEPFAGHTINTFPNLQTMDEVDFLYRIRDLQWIKPHRQGTLEFRNMPALPTVDHIVNLCQLRLDAVKQLL